MSLTDIEVILSGEESSSCPGVGTNSCEARPPIEQIVVDGDLQTLRPAQLPPRRRTWGGPKRYLSTIARTGEHPRPGYVPNAAYA
jgi:hypothetical protein